MKFSDMKTLASVPAAISSAKATDMSRRALMLGLPLFVAGCGISPDGFMFSGGDYGGINDGGHVIPPLDFGVIDRDKLRTAVAWSGKEKPGSVVVKIPERHLYLVMEGGRALRYSVGVGRSEGMNFRGTATIGRKEKWPHWTPTASMIAHIPRYRAYSGGMEGGIENPLGARALYLYRGGTDTYFRLHGTTEPETIGSAVSSGCIRLFNQDIIDLYNRVPLGATVTVIQG
jgi:lipoprotein-anchoring transpeptidase ErfK/SrfK